MKVEELVKKVEEAQMKLRELDEAMDELDEDNYGHVVLSETYQKILADLNSMLKAEVEFIRTPINVEDF